MPRGTSCRHIRTQYHPRSSRPWQNDYVFALRKLLGEGALRCAEVIDAPHLRRLSDHLPLRIELAVPDDGGAGRQRCEDAAGRDQVALRCRSRQNPVAR